MQTLHFSEIRRKWCLTRHFGKNSQTPRQMEHSKRLILASQSPRRKELLGALGLDFEVRIREINEDFPTEFTPLEAVRHISKNKALAFQDLCAADPNLVVLSADTVVVLDRQVIGKPKDFEEAF